MSKAKKLSGEQYEGLGRQLVSLYDSLNPDRKVVYRVNFIKGLWSGLGGVVGATVGIALLLWLLSLFGQLPFLGHFIDMVRQTIENKR